MFARYGTSTLPSPTSTTRPPVPSSISGIAKWLVIRCVSMPLRSTPRVASSGCSHTGLPHWTNGSPPQTSLTRMSSRPWSLRIRSTSARTSSASAWSQRTAMPSPPAAVTSSAVSSIVSGRSIGERPARVERPLP